MDFKEKLIKTFLGKSIVLDEKAINRFVKYKELLLEWNDKINLTAITDEVEIIEKHFIDSLSITRYIKEEDRVADIGTGAGFPGIPLAIFFDSKIQLNLIDSLNKRLIFLDEVVKQLGLNNITIIHARAEEMGRDIRYRENYDKVVSRAVSNLNTLSEYCMPLVKVKGNVIFMKGSNANEELSNAKITISKLSGEIIGVDPYKIMDDIEHINIIVKKINKISEKYPRHSSKIKNQPL